MSGKTPLVASAEQRDDLKRLAFSANRAEADRARAILLSLVSLEERGDRRGFRAEEALRAKIPEGARGHRARLALDIHARRLACAKAWPVSSDTPLPVVLQ